MSARCLHVICAVCTLSAHLSARCLRVVCALSAHAIYTSVHVVCMLSACCLHVVCMLSASLTCMGMGQLSALSGSHFQSCVPCKWPVGEQCACAHIAGGGAHAEFLPCMPYSSRCIVWGSLQALFASSTPSLESVSARAHLSFGLVSPCRLKIVACFMGWQEMSL